ncbi:MAG TPA: DUF3800 domain-containing protein [Candidatus Paceibacterota bacterium]
MGAEEYYLYIDDSGTRQPDTNDPASVGPTNYFALGGVLIKKGDRDTVAQKFNQFCSKWNITYPLHSTDIRNRKKNFRWVKGEKGKVFLKDLSDFLVDIPVIGFAAVIHRDGYNKRYQPLYGKNRWHLCKTVYSILIERACKYIGSDSNLRIRFEECGTKEQENIENYTKDLVNSGMPFDPNTSSSYSSLTSDDFRKIIKGKPERKKKVSTYMQIADLYLYPMVRRKRDPGYYLWQILFKNKKIIDALIPSNLWRQLGIKYSCFDI